MPKKMTLAVKRVFDIFFSLILTLLLFPVCIITARAVKIFVSRTESPIFTQMQIGKNGNLFKIYKFRTIDPKSTDEVRIIPKFGAFLRRSKLDEFPQMLNILKGDMSFVGPRPYQPKDCIGIDARRNSVRPGLTGLGQVNGNTMLDMPTRLKYDLYYIDNFSLWLDMKILCKTIFVVIFGEHVSADIRIFCLDLSVLSRVFSAKTG